MTPSSLCHLPFTLRARQSSEKGVPLYFVPRPRPSTDRPHWPSLPLPLIWRMRDRIARNPRTATAQGVSEWPSGARCSSDAVCPACERGGGGGGSEGRRATASKTGGGGG